MELITGADVSELKKPDKETKLGGAGGGGVLSAIVIEHVANGWILRFIDPILENEDILVFSDRNALMNELSKYI